MIIVGYPEIGKRTLAGEDNCIDLNFNLFYPAKCYMEKLQEISIRNYCDVAVDLSKQGYTVFVSSHEAVLNRLTYIAFTHNEDIAIIYPSIKLKDEWIEKLKVICENINTMEAYNAWKNAEKMYDQNIKDLNDPDRAMKYDFIRYEIESMDYDLSEILNRIKINPKYRKRDE